MLTFNKTIDEIEADNYDTAIVPIASLEQHGPHLPVNTDIVIADAFAAGIADKLNAYLLPTIPISTNREHMGKRGGAVWMDPKTCMDMLTDICLCLAEQGFKKIVILCSHGGVFILPPTVRYLNAKYNPDLAVCKLDIMQVYDDLFSEGILETKTGIHADEFETSVMLHLCPELVKMDQAIDFVPNEPREYLNYASIFRICPDGVWGEPTKASAEKGRKCLERGIELGTKKIEDAFGFITGKQPYGYSNF